MIDIEKLKKVEMFTIDEDHVWGYQIRMVNGDEYCGKFMVLENGEKGSNHFHKDKTETFIVFLGQVMIYMDHDGVILNEGDSMTLVPGERHQMQAWKFPAIVLEVSTHDDDNDTYRIREGE